MRSLLAVCLLSTVALAASPQDTLTLRLKLAPDQTVRYQSHTSLAQELMGQDISQTIDMVMSMATKKAEGGTQVALTFTDVKLTMPENLPVNPDDIAKSMQSLKATAVYDELGKSSNFQIDGDAMAKMLMGSTGGIRMGFLGIEYPDAPIKVGDTWNVEYDMTSALAPAQNQNPPAKKAVIPIAYTLTKVENGVATVSAKMKGKIDTEGPNGMAMTLDMDSTTEYLVDVSTGIPASITTKGHNTIDFGMGTMDQNVQSSMKKL